MATESVQPLRISKMTPTTSPSKLPRPLAEIGSTERRRNSPSYNQATRKMIVSRDSSPFETSVSPFRSPRPFWEKDTMSSARFGSENVPERSPSPSPNRRPSVENLKKASRVANSPMFARESKDMYDPSSSPNLERPLTDRPLSDRIQQNPFSRYDSIRKENNPFKSPEKPTHRRTESKSDITDFMGTRSSAIPRASTPVKEPISPTKSSLSRFNYLPPALRPASSMGSDEEDETRVATPRGSLRAAKSVTFQSAPPEINEYEQQTPEPSSVASGSRESSYDSEEYEENSFERDISADQDDSFDASLEDTDKTPVVLPGDWRHASPETARTQLVDDFDDVFDDGDAGSPLPTATPSKSFREPQITVSARSESVTSEGSVRPLPPIPAVTSPERGRRSSGGLFAAAERASSVQRTLPSPPRPASVSKDEIWRMRETNMSLEDRMGLLALQESLSHDNKPSSFGLGSPAQLHAKTSINSLEQAEQDEVGDLPDLNYAPKISRESILRKVQSDMHDDYADEEDRDKAESLYSDQGISYSELAKLDPDVAIPSRETSTHFDLVDTVAIKEEPEDSQLDLNDVPSLALNPEFMDEQRQGSVVYHDMSVDASESHYSSPDSLADQGMEPQQGDGLGITNDETFSTPMEEPVKKNTQKSMDLPFLSNFLAKDDYDFGLKAYMTPPDLSLASVAPTLDDNREKSEVSRMSPLGAAEIHSDNASQTSLGSSAEKSLSEVPLYEQIEEPVIPERRATIKTGGKLKARPSGSRADLEAMIAGNQEDDHPVPAIPDKYRDQPQDPAETADCESLWSQPSAAESGESKNDSAVDEEPRRRVSGKVKLDLDLPTTEMGALSQEMERVLEGQKKGYLMRQNTKVVVASNRNFSNETASLASPAMTATSFDSSRGPGSPRKASAGEKFIKTEPWNGKMRRKSSRKSSGRRSNIGPAPPLPGQESALGTLEEYSTIDDDDEDTERGRLFVKVVGVKDLDLPLPRNDRLFFQLTLDNGLHCVTTANLDLNRSAPIGQEFELVVLEDLEFQLTLTTKLPPAPKPQSPIIAAPPSPTKAPKSPTKSVFSRLLSSPKKRAAQEQKERAEAEEAERRRQAEEQRKRASLRPTPWDKMRELVDANTGSFARSYISLKSHEEQCFGRQFTVDVPLFNEWALEKDTSVVNSVRSKRGNGIANVRRPPYTIGSLELQLLYIPRPKDATDDDMPKSMSGAVREMAAAEQIKETKHEGCLSQQGGDCPYWRRRFFKLSGTKLTAYHEHTMQPRATINLQKASKLIDDKTSLVANPTSGNPSSSKRRKSAFAEEDDGYQFVEEGFRLRFANGETIDFYADNAAMKDEWMAVLSQCVGKAGNDAKVAKWTDMVLKAEKSDTTKIRPKSADDAAALVAHGPPSPVKGPGPDIRVQAPSRDVSGNSTMSRGTTGSPVKSAIGSVLRKEITVAAAPAVPIKDVVSMGAFDTPPMSPRTGHRDRKAVQSMIF